MSAPPVDGLRAALALLRPRGTRGEAVVAALLVMLGFALALSVRSNAPANALTTARSEDLVRLLDDLDSRATRLRAEQQTLQDQASALAAGGGGEALAQATTRAAELGVLAGTVAATGPGIVVTVTDPREQVGADVMLDVIEELRDAGAEAIDFSGVRVVASTWVLDRPGGITVDGTALSAPYRLTVIGDSPTLAAALKIPGGVVATVDARPGAHADVTTAGSLRVTSLRALTRPAYARPTG